MASDDFEIPPVQSGADIGQALKAMRERKKLSLEEVADITRVRRAYLADIEAMRLDKLPSRPFTIGYIRAYAEALGLDGEAAVERFKRRSRPTSPARLRARRRDPRWPSSPVVVMLVAIIPGTSPAGHDGYPTPPIASAKSPEAFAAQKADLSRLARPRRWSPPPATQAPGLPTNPTAP